MAHSSEVRAELVLSASEMCLAPSAPMRLSYSLRARAHFECQRLLTVEKRACGGALESGDRRVRLEEVGHDLRALCLELIPAETATEASKGAHQNAST